jgi:hypothetical protein
LGWIFYFVYNTPSLSLSWVQHIPAGPDPTFWPTIQWCGPRRQKLRLPYSNDAADSHGGATPFPCGICIPASRANDRDRDIGQNGTCFGRPKLNETVPLHSVAVIDFNTKVPSIFPFSGFTSGLSFRKFPDGHNALLRHISSDALENNIPFPKISATRRQIYEPGNKLRFFMGRLLFSLQITVNGHPPFKNENGILGSGSNPTFRP